MAYLSGPTQDHSSDSAILQILELLSRPSKALWTGVGNIGTDKGFLGGAWEGLSGGPDSMELADVLGLPEAQDTDEWLPYIAKGAARLGANVIGDPTTYAGGGIPKIAGALGIKGAAQGARGLRSLKVADDIAEYVAGTPFGRAFFQDAPMHQEAFRLAELGARTGGNQTRQFVNEEMKSIADKLGQYGLTAKDMPRIRLAMEEPHRAAELLGDQADDIVGILQPLKDKAFSQFERRNELYGKFGMDMKEPVAETATHGFVPRPLSEEGRFLLSRKGQPGRTLLDASEPQSRELMRFVSADDMAKGKLVDPLESPIVTKLDDKFLERNRIQKRGNDYWLETEPGTFQRVQPVQASLGSIERSGVMPAKAFLEDPRAAFGADILKKQGQINYLEFIEERLQAGADLVDTAKQALPDGWRNLRVKGLEHLAAPPWAANSIENLSGVMLDPQSSFGWMEAGLKAVENSPIGQALKKYTQVWSRNQLALHPGFHVANAVSNQVLAFLSGIKNPYRLVEAGKVQAGTGSEVIEGLSNQMLRSRFVEGGLISPETITDVFDPISRAGEKRWSEYFTKRLPGASGEYVQEGVSKMQRLNDYGFKLGATIESNNRVAMAIDYMKKAMSDGARLDDDLFGKAILHAKEYGLTYDNLDPMTRRLKMYAPFAAWSRQIIGRFLKDLGQQPGKLANLERFTETLFQPMSATDMEVMPDYLKTQGPVGGILGHQFETESGSPGVFLSSRYNPFGTIEDLVRRPTAAIGGQAAPWIKAPYKVVSGRDIFSQQDIDPVAGTGIASLINPMGLGDYGLASRKFLGMNVPAMPRSLLSETPISRYATAADTLGANTLWEDTSRPEMSLPEKATWYVSGGKTYPFDYGKAYAAKNSAWKREVSTLRIKMTSAYSQGDTEAGDTYRQMLVNKMQRGPLGHSMSEGS